jgi:hypothetical protein
MAVPAPPHYAHHGVGHNLKSTQAHANHFQLPCGCVTASRIRRRYRFAKPLVSLSYTKSARILATALNAYVCVEERFHIHKLQELKIMKKVSILAAGIFMVGLIASRAFGEGLTAHQDDGFFATEVQLDYSQINSGGNLAAFIPTGSDSEVCLVNLGDSATLYGGQISPPVCIRRTYNGIQGVVVLIMPYVTPLLSNVTVRVTLYQKGAHYYGEPVLYPSL